MYTHIRKEITKQIEYCTVKCDKTDKCSLEISDIYDKNKSSSKKNHSIFNTLEILNLISILLLDYNSNCEEKIDNLIESLEKSEGIKNKRLEKKYMNKRFISYGKQYIDDEDINSVIDVNQGDDSIIIWGIFQLTNTMNSKIYFNPIILLKLECLGLSSKHFLKLNKIKFYGII